jgi:CO/xanthine dehydrogenase FAD-binding subunit
MIYSYHRPNTLDEALDLLARPDGVALGGGTYISTPAFDKSRPIAIVDLQNLPLAGIEPAGDSLRVGARVTLQQLLETSATPDVIRHALRYEAPINTRNLATVAGTLVVADGRSPFATVLLAFDARLTLISKGSTETASLTELLTFRGEAWAHKLITEIRMPLNVGAAWEGVSRTPREKPIVSVALSLRSGGRLRMALGGYGPAPILGLDAADRSGLEPAARNALHGATDEWASSEYRQDAAVTLVRRCLSRLEIEEPA